ncbi:HAMP domain-containing histidine kinase [Ilyomonas limi]|uniref:histidine kinase n=1 Tax=Ilyomonas limi TaxID=2575867 RepID=A0A4U3L904_9BACT|nr:HAMP domain-containing sensor histidine kinase [Ilyomonas limi]TKK70954.1 HAMP domain-containing histidine kinase [Ilyomonas limi]
MKKIFPVIVVLVALSVLGIIVIQISWLNNLLRVQQDNYEIKITKAISSVASELSNQGPVPAMRLPRSGMHLFPFDFNFTVRPALISSRYTTNEIYVKLQKALSKEGLKNLPFEFAITSNASEMEVEMQSKYFFSVYNDSINSRTFYTPVMSEVNNDIPQPAFEHIYISVPNFNKEVRNSLLWVLLSSVAFTIIVIAAFFLTVKTIINQRNLSKIKNDFINNMTHELKTPLATISLAVDALQNSKVQSNPEKSNYFSGIIRQENKRMNKHVETILQAALMDKNELKLNFAPLNAHAVIEKVLNGFKLQLEEKGGTAELHLNAKNDLISADEVHFTNLINNLIDNAVKYSKEDLHLIITTHCTTRYLVIQVQDNGIGMSKETVKRIFEKFYRAHTGNVHNVKGFGLGMSYVKQVVDAHQGKIKVESTLGKGSTFILDIPLYKAEA